MGWFESQLSIFANNNATFDYVSPSKCYEYYRKTPIIQQCISVICHNINLLEQNKLSHINMNILITHLLIGGKVFLTEDLSNIYGVLDVRQQQNSSIYIVNLSKEIKKYKKVTMNISSISTMESIQLAIEISYLIKTHYMGLLQNGARPSGILTHGNIMSNSKRDTLKKELKDLYSNMEKGSIAVLEGTYQWNPIGICPEKLNLLENYNYFSKEIAMSFGVPPIILGISDPTFSNYKEAKDFLMENTCKPLLNLILSQL